jgi:FKBP-type peptidyl-prolyl cis-trans isomerase
MKRNQAPLGLALLLLVATAGCQPAAQEATTPPAEAPAATPAPSEMGPPGPPAPSAGFDTKPFKGSGKVITTDSGLKYEDMTIGTGAEAKSGSRANVHYTGTLTDGTQFDSSRDRGEPFTFTIDGGEVIRGWDEGVKGMKVGGRRKLTIPYESAYGEEGRPPTIPPKATLIFDVELMGVE